MGRLFSLWFSFFSLFFHRVCPHPSAHHPLSDKDHEPLQEKRVTGLRYATIAEQSELQDNYYMSAQGRLHWGASVAEGTRTWPASGTTSQSLGPAPLSTHRRVSRGRPP